MQDSPDLLAQALAVLQFIVTPPDATDPHHLGPLSWFTAWYTAVTLAAVLLVDKLILQPFHRRLTREEDEAARIAYRFYLPKDDPNYLNPRDHLDNPHNPITATQRALARTRRD